MWIFKWLFKNRVQGTEREMNESELRIQLQAEAAQQLDTRGLFCPEPVMLLHNVVRDMASGERVLVIATDPSTQRDVPKFCQFLGHSLERAEVDGDQYLYLIRKA